MQYLGPSHDIRVAAAHLSLPIAVGRDGCIRQGCATGWGGLQAVLPYLGDGYAGSIPEARICRCIQPKGQARPWRDPGRFSLSLSRIRSV